MVVAPNMNVVKGGVLIRSVTNLGNASGGVSTRKNLSWSLVLPITTIGIVGTHQMVFTNPIMSTYMNRIVDRPPMNSMATGGYKSIDATNPRGGYQGPSM
jgi:hypothetical protein